jgi:starvation-inducible DNA-binding protein
MFMIQSPILREGQYTDMANEIEIVINRQIANWTVLYTKLHNYHWNVKGPHFFTLHEKFEALYTEAAVHIDELAERLLAIGGSPVATLKESLATATLQEAQGIEAAEQMVTALAADFRTLIKEAGEGIEAAEQAGDEPTGDMLLGIQAGLQKHLWMLNAFLGK